MPKPRSVLSDLWSAVKPVLGELAAVLEERFVHEGPFIPCTGCGHAERDHCSDWGHCHGADRESARAAGGKCGGKLCECRKYVA